MSAPLLLLLLLEAGAPRVVTTAAQKKDRLTAEARAMKDVPLSRRMKELDADLEFEAVVPYARELGSRDSAPLELRRDAWLLEATALVVLGDPVSAERPFVRLLRLEPQFELPRTVEPKVALVFRKVRAEERELARTIKEAARRAQVARISIEGEPPTEARGGVPITFEVKVKDPAADVRAVTVGYRREGEPAFSSLALDSSNGEAWRGVLPAVLTESEQGFTLEYYTETSDPQGPLARAGSPEVPLRLHVSAGKCEQAWRAPLPRGLFAVGAGMTLAAGVVSGVFGVSLVEAQDRYSRFVDASGPRSFALQQQLEASGIQAAQRLTASLITAGAVALSTLIVALLTDWRD